jgi:hypothetical protein
MTDQKFSLPLPKSYRGNPKELEDFLSSVRLHFRIFPDSFFLDPLRVTFLVSCLLSSALARSNYVLASEELLYDNLARFLGLFYSQFSDPLSKASAAFELEL